MTHGFFPLPPHLVPLTPCLAPQPLQPSRPPTQQLAITMSSPTAEAPVVAPEAEQVVEEKASTRPRTGRAAKDKKETTTKAKPASKATAKKPAAKKAAAPKGAAAEHPSWKDIVKVRVFAYVDGGLPPYQSSHLGMCPTCLMTLSPPGMYRCQP